MLLSNGAKVLVCHRRLFVEDQARYFFGVVEDYCEGVAKVSGFTWTRDPTQGFQRKPDRRTKLIAVASGSVIVYELERETDLEAIRPRIVMSDLAAGSEYDWYYARTLGSSDGIIRTDQPLVPLDRFPSNLRGDVDQYLTIDQAVEWYELLLKRPEVL